MPHPKKVFLVPSGYNFRAVLAFCRALRAVGERPAVVACSEDDPIWRTAFAREVVFTRSEKRLELSEMISAVSATTSSRGPGRCVLAPTSEFLVRWALANRAELTSAGCELPLPEEAVYLRVTDKAAFTPFCRALGLPVPTELDHPRLPCVAKPRWNVSPEGRSLYPWLLRSQDDLARFREETRAGDFFFQEWVEGRSYYLLYHLSRTGTETAFSQENLAQQSGGKSVLLARSAQLHLTSEAARWAGALRAAGFHGLAMVELRERRGEFVMIEANPRLWGPLQLCLDGCPSLVLGYIAENLGVPPFAACHQEREAWYFWSGGCTNGEPVWHGRTKGEGVALWRHVASDVYLRADSWRHFLHEHVATRTPSPLPTSSSIPLPA